MPPSTDILSRIFGSIKRAFNWFFAIAKATPTPSAESRYYVAHQNESFKDGRYIAIHQLGSGLYSHVWLAKDLKYLSNFLERIPFANHW